MRQLSGTQARFQQNVNPTIAKRIVETAQRSGSAIALEDLQEIGPRVKARRQQRARHANWGFFQLRQFVSYKARLAGVPVIVVDPRYTSQECPRCHQISRQNRPTQAQFSCIRCGYAAPADLVAARTIRLKAAVNRPVVAQPRQLQLGLA